MFLEAIPTRLQSLKKLHGWKLENALNSLLPWQRSLEANNNTNMIARMLLILLENFMNISHWSNVVMHYIESHLRSNNSKWFFDVTT